MAVNNILSTKGTVRSTLKFKQLDSGSILRGVCSGEPGCRAVCSALTECQASDLQSGCDTVTGPGVMSSAVKVAGASCLHRSPYRSGSSAGTTACPGRGSFLG